MKACATNGCTDYAIEFHEFCHYHIHRAYPCAMEACPNMISDYNKSGYCYDHRWVAQKMRRLKRAEEIENNKYMMIRKGNK